MDELIDLRKFIKYSKLSLKILTPFNKKFMKLLLLFTYKNSLELWNDIGILSREIEIYKRLIEKGVEVSFLTYGDEKDNSFKQTLGDINIYPIANLIKSKSSILMLLKSFRVPFKLKNTFKNIDIIKTNQVDGFWLGLIAKIFFKKKLVIRAGFEWYRNYINMPRPKTLKGMISFYLNYIYVLLGDLIAYKTADSIISTNKSDINFIIKRFRLKKRRNKIVHIPNYIDTTLFAPKNINKKDKHVLFVGRLSAEKNLVNLLHAFKIQSDLTLDIIGSGENISKYKELSKKLGCKVNFLGTVPNKEIPKIINQYELFILTSYFEGNPKALLEAMSCGVACIGTNVRGIKDVITHGENGFLCDLNYKSIADSIKSLYNNKDLMKKIGSNARKYVEENCSIHSILQTESALYKKLIKKS